MKTIGGDVAFTTIRPGSRPISIGPGIVNFEHIYIIARTSWSSRSRPHLGPLTSSARCCSRFWITRRAYQGCTLRR